MKKLFIAFIALMMTIIFVLFHYLNKFDKYASAQCSDVNVIKVESISMVASDGPVNNGHEYIDLGLSVKWATCNVGANSPEEYGDYFAWGETQPKSTYDWSTYKWCNGSYNNLTKYCTRSDYGRVDNRTRLEKNDDAARMNWGGSWRMPTRIELNELLNNCTWTWTTQNGVNGYKVTSKSNGNSIFLPAAGLISNSSFFFKVGSNGYYWSSSLDGDNSAYSLHFSSDSMKRDHNERCKGCSVRLVCP